MRAGAFDYVLKPFDLEHVEVAVRRALEHQHLLVEKRRYETYLERDDRAAHGGTRRRSALARRRVPHDASRRSSAALETRDSETHGHSERVVNFSCGSGGDGADEEQMRSLEFGSLLHDVGKIGVPDAMLRKPARADREEWYEMREHPLHGQQILGGIEFLEGAARVVAQHHEKWDGSGYPAGTSRRGDRFERAHLRRRRRLRRHHERPRLPRRRGYEEARARVGDLRGPPVRPARRRSLPPRPAPRSGRRCAVVPLRARATAARRHGSHERRRFAPKSAARTRAAARAPEISATEPEH
jgi:hypothetical protein